MPIPFLIAGAAAAFAGKKVYDKLTEPENKITQKRDSSTYHESQGFFQNAYIERGYIMKSDMTFYKHVGFSNGNTVIHKTQAKNGVTEDNWDFFFDGVLYYIDKTIQNGEVIERKIEAPKIWVACRTRDRIPIEVDWRVMELAKYRLSTGETYLLGADDCQEFVASCIEYGKDFVDSGYKREAYKANAGSVEGVIKDHYGEWDWYSIRYENCNNPKPFTNVF